MSYANKTIQKKTKDISSFESSHMRINVLFNLIKKFKGPFGCGYPRIDFRRSCMNSSGLVKIILRYAFSVWHEKVRSVVELHFNKYINKRACIRNYFF